VQVHYDEGIANHIGAETNQDANRVAISGHRGHVVLGFARFRHVSSDSGCQCGPHVEAQDSCLDLFPTSKRLVWTNGGAP
jgi:hypothetical protein